MSKVMEILKKIAKGIFAVGKGIIDFITGSMKKQWTEWDKEAEEEKKRQQESQEPKKDLYDEYEEIIWGKKKK